jgi:hypothetical protein
MVKIVDNPIQWRVPIQLCSVKKEGKKPDDNCLQPEIKKIKCLSSGGINSLCTKVRSCEDLMPQYILNDTTLKIMHEGQSNTKPLACKTFIQPANMLKALYSIL